MTNEPIPHEVDAPSGRLRGELHLSSEDFASEKPTIIIRTPYDASAHRPLARSWNERGHHCLVQDVRGRYGSDGPWIPYSDEDVDGAATVDLVTADPDLADDVLVFGASYAAHCALEAARSRPRHVVGVIALVPAVGLYETAHAGGTQRIRDRIGWWEQHGFGRRSGVGPTAAELDVRTAAAIVLGPTVAAEIWGWDERRLGLWRRLWTCDPVDLLERYSHCTMPLLVMSGEYDFFDTEARQLASMWNGSSTFRTGPWGHRMLAGIVDSELRERVRQVCSPAGFIDDWLETLTRTTSGGPQ